MLFYLYYCVAVYTLLENIHNSRYQVCRIIVGNRTSMNVIPCCWYMNRVAQVSCFTDIRSVGIPYQPNEDICQSHVNMIVDNALHPRIPFTYLNTHTTQSCMYPKLTCLQIAVRAPYKILLVHVLSKVF